MEEKDQAYQCGTFNNRDEDWEHYRTLRNYAVGLMSRPWWFGTHLKL